MKNMKSGNCSNTSALHSHSTPTTVKRALVLTWLSARSFLETASSVANNLGEGIRGAVVDSTAKLCVLSTVADEDLPRFPRLLFLLLLSLLVLVCAVVGSASGEPQAEPRRRCGAVVGEGNVVAGERRMEEKGEKKKLKSRSEGKNHPSLQNFLPAGLNTDGLGPINPLKDCIKGLDSGDAWPNNAAAASFA